MLKLSRSNGRIKSQSKPKNCIPRCGSATIKRGRPEISCSKGTFKGGGPMNLLGSCSAHMALLPYAPEKREDVEEADTLAWSNVEELPQNLIVRAETARRSKLYTVVGGKCTQVIDKIVDE